MVEVFIAIALTKNCIPLDKISFQLEPPVEVLILPTDPELPTDMDHCGYRYTGEPYCCP